ncbi:uncharacterized protein involved in outer membrane biogenesis [Bradyrhizobium ottawaense]
MQTTLLGLAIAFIIALLAALIGPYYVDWNQFRPQFEAEAGKIIGVPVRVAGELDARLLPAPTLRLRQVTFGGNNDLGRLRADKLDVEFSLGSLMRGEWRATELSVGGMAVDLGLDARGRVDLPSTASGTFNLASLAIERLNLTGRIALHDAASRSTLELNDIAFSGDVRSLAGSVRGDGRFTAAGVRYPFRVSSGPSADGSATRLHLNIDPGERAILADLEGVLAFDNRLPKFDGALTLAVPAVKKAGEAGPTPWKLTTKLKADPAGAKFEQIDANFGAEDNALKLGGVGDLRFGAAPLLRAVLSARQVDADKLAGKDDAEPLRILPALRAGLAAIPQAPIPAQIEFNSDQIMLGGRPLQNIAAELQTDGRSWTFQRLELRAPGMTQLSLNGAAPGADSFSGRLSVESSDPDALVAWLQGRSEINRRSTRPLRLAGDVTIAANHLAIDRLKADIEGGTVEGRIAFVQTGASKGSRIDAELKADRLDLDTAASFVRALAGPQGEWPEEAKLSLDIGRAISAGQELRPFAAKLAFGPASLSLEQLRFGQASGVTTEASGSFDRTKATGKLALKSSANSLRELTALVEPFAPAVRARFDAIPSLPGATRLKLDLSLDKNAEHADRSNARAVLDLDAPQLKATATLAAQMPAAAVNGVDIDKLRNSDFTLDSKVSAPQAGALLVLLGLDRVVAAGEGASQFEGKLTGAWRRPLQLNAKLSGGGLDADAQGSVELSESKASVNLRVRKANLAPLFGTSPADKSMQAVSLSSRLTLSGNRLTFDDLDGNAAGSHLRGHLAVTLDQERSVDGEVGLDTLDLAPALAMAIGAAGHESGEPLSAGLLGGWRGRIAFQALRGMLPGGIELRPFGGTLRSDGQSLALDALKGRPQWRRDVGELRRTQRREWSCAERAHRSQQCRCGDAALSRSRAAEGARHGADGADQPGPQRRGAHRRARRQRHGDAGLRGNRRPQSARLRDRHPRQRRWPGRRRQPPAAARRARACRRADRGGLGADPVHDPRRTLTRRRDPARSEECPRHRLRRLRHSRRSGRHPRQPDADHDRALRRAARNPAVRGGPARQAQSHDRPCAAVVVACGAHDRPRDAPARRHRARRAAAGDRRAADAGLARSRAGAGAGQCAAAGPGSAPRTVKAESRAAAKGPAGRARRAKPAARPTACAAAAGHRREACTGSAARQAQAEAAAGPDAAESVRVILVR